MQFHCTAPRKTITAQPPGVRVGEIVDMRGLSDWTDNTATDRTESNTERAQIWDREYARDREAQFNGFHRMRAPIAVENESLVAALNSSRSTTQIQRRIHPPGNTWFTDVSRRRGKEADSRTRAR